MEPNARYVQVGLFVILLGLLPVLALLWLGLGVESQDTKKYLVYFEKHSLNGLSPDSDVTMKGVSVGNVDSYQISPDDIEKVRVLVRLRKETPIKTDTKAVIQRNLLTGLARIDLVGSTSKSPLLSEPSEGHRYPVIPEGQTRFESLTDSIPSALEEINRVVGRVSSFLSEENIAHINTSFKNVDEFTTALAAEKESFQKLMDRVDEISRNVQETSSAIRSVTAQAEKTMSGLDTNLENVLTDLNRAIGTLNSELKSTSKSIQTTSQVLAQEVTVISQEFTQAARTFSRAMEEFENPRKILTGPGKKSLGPGEKK